MGLGRKVEAEGPGWAGLQFLPSETLGALLGWGQLISKWHSESFQVSPAAFLASGSWKHCLCSQRWLAGCGSVANRPRTALPAEACPPTAVPSAVAPPLGLFHLKGPVRETTAEPLGGAHPTSPSLAQAST